MSNDNLNRITNQQTITSMEIAEITGKNHYDVMKAIRKMEPAWEEIQGGKFSVLQRVTKLGNGGTKKNPYYSLTKTECLFVATKFNDVARAKLVLRWEQLEKEKLVQQTQPEPQPSAANGQCSTVNGCNLPVDPRNMSRLQILQLALQAEEENERLRAEKEELEADKYGLMIENGHKDQQIQELQERTAYLGVIMADTSTVTVSQIAQDYGMSAVKFNNLLNGLRIQRKVGEQWVLYAEYLNRGYVATRMIPIHHSGKPDTHRPLTAWTQAWRRFLYEELKRNRILPLIECRQAALPSAPSTVGTRQGQEGAAV